MIDLSWHRKGDHVFFGEDGKPKYYTDAEFSDLLGQYSLGDFQRCSGGGMSHCESVPSDSNFIIKGDNLLALHLLRKDYDRRVKCIYIDPPYNTGSKSFSYKDSFGSESWLSFMRSRLVVSRELLRDDGGYILPM